MRLIDSLLDKVSHAADANGASVRSSSMDGTITLWSTVSCERPFEAFGTKLDAHGAPSTAEAVAVRLDQAECSA